MTALVFLVLSLDTALLASAGVKFSFTAPNAKKIKVYGSFNGWSKGYVLVKAGSGIWEQSVELQRGRYEYKYLVDGKWQHDARLPTINDGLLGKNNVVIVR